MTKNRWQKIKKILDEVLDLPIEEQEARLAPLRTSDAELYSEVMTYLAHDKDPEDPFATPLFDLIAGRPPELRAGQTIGSYRLRGEIARGGMGVVYEAFRIQGGFEQTVAIKVMKQGFETGNFIRRFRRERQILADLDHPNIAHLISGGTTDDGLPFLVMEKVEGTRLDVFCREQRLGLEERLALFLEICDAVHAAHQRLVVHCDLKPSNILVTPEGRPKLLDFGISKVLQQDSDTITRSLSLRIGTLPYASPEQMAGLTINTSTDVFALGCILYLLLTGRPPAPIGEGTGQPETPSKAPSSGTSTTDAISSQKRWRQKIRGDLDAIVLKAMAGDPARRYNSAADLAADLRRHQSKRPIEAKPATWRYELSLFLRRKKNEVAIGAVSMLFVLGAVGIASSFGIKARLESLRANEMLAAYLELLEVFDSTAGESRAETLRTAISRLSSAEKFSIPADMARIYDRLGRMLYRHGDLEEAQELLDRALEIRRSLPEVSSEDLAASLNNLSLVYKDQGDLSTAADLLYEALDLHETEKDPERAETLDSLHNLGALEEAQGNLQRAEELYERALVRREAKHGPVSLEVAKTTNNLGKVLKARGRLQEAQDAYERSLEIREQILGPDHAQTAIALQNLGELLSTRGDFDRAIAYYRRALAIREQAFGKEHQKYALTQSGLAVALLSRGSEEDLSRASTLLGQAVTNLRRDPGRNHEITWIVETNLASVLLELDRVEEAEGLIRRIQLHATPWNHRDSWRGAHLRNLLGGVLAAQGNFQEARPLLLESQEVLERETSVSSRYSREARRRWQDWNERSSS